MDRNELERARADIEQALLDVDVASIELAFTDDAQLLLDRTALARQRGARAAEALELGELGIELAGQIVRGQQIALQLATRGLRDALHRHDRVDFEPALLADAARDLARQRQHVTELAPVQYEHE